MLYFIIWMAMGYFGALASIIIFRTDGSAKQGELYLALVAPFLGPVVILLTVWDLWRR